MQDGIKCAGLKIGQNLRVLKIKPVLGRPKPFLSSHWFKNDQNKLIPFKCKSIEVWVLVNEGFKNFNVPGNSQKRTKCAARLLQGVQTLSG